MAKKKIEEEVFEDLDLEDFELPKGVAEITETFGSGDLNLLRDKINELIRNQ